FALHLRVAARGDGVALELTGTEGFTAPHLALLLDRYDTLLADALARPDAPVAALAVMSAEERTRVLGSFNRAAARRIPAPQPVHVLFEAQAARTPDAEAVRVGSRVLTYAELNRGANRRARHLRAAGVGPEARVGIMLPSSPERLETVLAVFKAGGAYVPLDPSYPRDRLDFMIRDAGLRLVLTRGELRPSLPDVEGVEVLAWDEVAEPVAGHPDGDLELPGVDPAGAAYVIYTSGSTGIPKGVVVEHRALAGHGLSVGEHFGLAASDRVLQFASFNFDASVEQMLAPLLCGACVVLREEGVPSVEALGRLVADSGLTVLNLPTAQWHLLAEEWARGEAVPDTSRLRLMIAGGEAMLPSFVRRWRETPAGGARLLNAYGPTEAVVTASTFEVPADFGADGLPLSVPIGRPIGSRAAYVLDERMEPVPIGVPGELHLGGEQLARGYLARPELTADRFVPDPFSADPGARMYRTGDRVRWQDDGTLEFLGRVDHQVKVRGFRIELGEIEAVLNRHAEIQQCSVVVEERSEAEKQLVAYWVPAGEPLPTSAQLRAFLQERVPEYMVPGAFVALHAMPLTAVGKVDRSLLSAQRRIQVERSFVPPSTPVEEQVAAIWCEVMKLERVSMDDNFFELGGHSLLATQLTSRIRKHFGIDLQIGRVIDAETVAELSRVVEPLLEARGEGGEEMEMESIGPAARDGRRIRATDLTSLVDE
ncbi:MAG TPA: amino acid adenylation domain-containing protein, partial [Longimicrobiaceae bacterium]|nr:amino acid adenylation domain-containing protein [Longimicrobiaceae bacterium]